MKTLNVSFKPYKIRELYGGVSYLFKFENNYGASVVCHQFSYGGKNGLWELAVLKFDNSDKDIKFNIDYSTSVTSNVEGCLSDSEVDLLLQEIFQL